MDGLQLKRARELRGYTLEQASEIIGISKSHLWRLEKDRCKTTIDTGRKLAKLYGLTLNDLFMPEMYTVLHT